MILGQFNLIHIPTFSHKIYFNITVFYNPRLRVTAVQEVSPQTVCHFVSFHSSWTDRKCHGLSFSVCPYEHTHTHTPLPCRKTQLASNTMHYLFQPKDSDQGNISSQLYLIP